MGAYDLSCHYMEHKVQQAEAMKAAKARILEVAARFEALTGRKYGLFEAYRMEDAEVALVLIGSSAGTAKVAVDQLREQGVKAGLIKIRVFRPFPAQELAQALENVKALAIMDKAESFSANGGPLFSEVRGALYDLEPRPRTVGYVYGLGGRDITPAHFHDVFARLQAIAAGENWGRCTPIWDKGGKRYGSHRPHLSFQENPGEEGALRGGPPPLRRLRGGDRRPGGPPGSAGGGPCRGGQRHRLPGGQLLPLPLHRL